MSSLGFMMIKLTNAGLASVGVLLAGVFILFPLTLTGLNYILKGKRAWLRVIVLITFAAFVAYLTVWGRPTTLRKFRIMLTPFGSYTGLSSKFRRLQLISNIGIFIPLGCLIPWSTRARFKETLGLCFAFSLLIELAQLVTRAGYCEVDDVINNTVGAALGYLMWRMLSFLWGRMIPCCIRKTKLMIEKRRQNARAAEEIKANDNN